jgi:hypothetical protein
VICLPGQTARAYLPIWSAVRILRGSGNVVAEGDRSVRAEWCAIVVGVFYWCCCYSSLRLPICFRVLAGRARIRRVTTFEVQGPWLHGCDSFGARSVLVSWRRGGVRPVAPAMSTVSRRPRSRGRRWFWGRGNRSRRRRRSGARPHRHVRLPSVVGAGTNGSGCWDGRGAGDHPAAARLRRQHLVRPCSDHCAGKCGGAGACPGHRIPASRRRQAQPPVGVCALMPSRPAHRHRTEEL